MQCICISFKVHSNFDIPVPFTVWLSFHIKKLELSKLNSFSQPAQSRFTSSSPDPAFLHWTSAALSNRLGFTAEQHVLRILFVFSSISSVACFQFSSYLVIQVRYPLVCRCLRGKEIRLSVTLLNSFSYKMIPKLFAW